MANRLLIKNGFVVSQDPAIGNRPETDILVEDGKIVAVAPGLDTVDAEVVDATGTVVIPGFIDTHRHTWETATRGLLPSCTIDQYLGAMIATLGPAYRPQDIYAGNLLGSLEALNAGITTLVDWSHCNNTPEHTDAGIAGLREAGIRAMYAHGTPASAEAWVDSVLPHSEDARRVRSEHFSSDNDLLTFAMALRGPGICRPEIVEHDWRLARELASRITVHVGMRITGLHTQAVNELHKAGLMGPDTTYVHATTTTDEEIQHIADTGGTISIAPYVEMVLGLGHPPTGRAMDRGLNPTLSVDVVCTAPGDMFTQMRTALAQDRIRSFGDDADVPFTARLTHADLLQFATLNGAIACGLEDRVGSLSIGKDADIVLIRADSINTMPLVDPVATVTTSADTSNVDTVIVRGEIRKRDGRLVGVDMPRLRALAEESRDSVLTAAGLTPEWQQTNAGVR
ncbi:amidohydrolase family protein [Streptomyces albipurpureus]|uniref:Amidohydrolase family protein n=1 Tax=Streptomyces albipurpureus TaxID=2897419 RepID=A0ABT0UK41_9ACTN|nr:amidohydrolase family protein [Streptomyces sp. CWNU-1]MCM2388622.1 amidohydrolase family protein [Streptomyces sp. CWNU-1]